MGYSPHSGAPDHLSCSLSHIYGWSVLNTVLLLPTYCPLHLLQVTRYIGQSLSQVKFCLILYFFPVLVLEKVFPSSITGQDTLQPPHFLQPVSWG